jgi:methylmalonyl-CoA mutase cobalamin-binding subunit
MVDALGQLTRPTGHAINPVPVTENERIPEIAEVIEAQLLAGRLAEHAPGWRPLLDEPAIDGLAAQLLAGAERFRDAVLRGMARVGIDTGDIFQMLLALRRIGARPLEADFGAGAPDPEAPGGRRAVVPATILAELAEMAEEATSDLAEPVRVRLRQSGLGVLVAAGDVHEHGKMLVENVARRLGLKVLDGGVSTDPGKLADLAVELGADAIAISTYNGVALTYYRALEAALAERGRKLPVLIGGRLNQIPEGSNSSLPVDVGDELSEAGALVCRAAADLAPALMRFAAAAN